MATIRICDVCRNVAGRNLWRLRVAGPVHPHDGERIVESVIQDVCDGCLRRVPDLSTGHTLEELSLMRLAPEVADKGTEEAGH